MFYQQIQVLAQTYYVVGTAKAVLYLSGDNESLDDVLAKFPEAQVVTNNPLFLEVERQLTAYFTKQRTELSFPVDLRGTPFQQAVWAALQTVGYGQTRSYLQIAQQLGAPEKVRAVANAIGKNPVLIIIPCHRILGQDGKLHGYRGGLTMKRNLLDLERS